MTLTSALSPDGQNRVVRAWRGALGAGLLPPDDGATWTFIERDDLDAAVSIRIGDAGLVAAPSAVLTQLRGAPEASLTDADALAATVPGSTPVGTAHLMYMDHTPDFSSGPEVRPATAADLDALRRDTSADEQNEAGIDELTSAWGIDSHDHTVAAIAGFSVWRADVAQLGVLSARRHRGQGMATAVAAAAVRVAVGRGLVAQWRCRVGNTASLALGEHLGFVRLGLQTTVVLRD